jgi:hypothetical protein
LLSILGDLDEQYGMYKSFVVHGVQHSEKLAATLEREGFTVGEMFPDGFSSFMVPDIRGALIWRDYSKSNHH